MLRLTGSEGEVWRNPRDSRSHPPRERGWRICQQSQTQPLKRRDCRAPRPPTVVAALLTLAVTAPFALASIDFARVAFGGAPVDTATVAALRLSHHQAANLVTFAFWMVAILTTQTTALALGILRRREWARHGAILTFVALAMIVLPLSLGGMTADPPAPQAWLGVLLGTAEVAIVVLLLTPALADDFDRTEWLRQRRSAPSNRA